MNQQELVGWTDLTLSRSKDTLTGELQIGVFMGVIPEGQVFAGLRRGVEVVYIGNHLAFTGELDRRRDTGSVNVSATSYTVQFTCRGKSRVLIDSSHVHPTGTMLRMESRDIFGTLLQPFGITLDWDGLNVNLDKFRLRDGGRVVDELQRLAEQLGVFVFETRDGRLRVTTSETLGEGEPLRLGTNILSFSADQAQDVERSDVVVKGQRTEATVWGEQAVLEPLLNSIDSTVSKFLPAVVQLYGNALPEALENRARYELNKRSSAAKRITVDVFHVQQTNGQPWDIGVQHYLEIGPAGIRGLFEVSELTYNVRNDTTLSTSLTLTPAVISSKTTGFMGAAGDTTNEDSAFKTSNWQQELSKAFERSVQPLEDGFADLLIEAAHPPMTIPGLPS
jgi:prophage tail gpP-like protein